MSSLVKYDSNASRNITVAGLGGLGVLGLAAFVPYFPFLLVAMVVGGIGLEVKRQKNR